MAIHPLAVVSPKAQLGQGVEVGPFAYIADYAVIGDGCIIMDHSTVLGGTRLGEGCRVHQGAVIGGDPQDKKYHGQPTFLEIGPRTVCREYVTISRATTEGKSTQIGADCLLMTGAHVGHDSFLGDNVTLANTVSLGGHCEIHDFAVVGGMTAVHQFVHIGTMAMVGGDSGLNQDAPPFMITSGPVPAVVYGLNTIGLQRNGVDTESRRYLKQAFRMLYRSELTLTEAVEQIKNELPLIPEVAELLKFIANSKRGLSGGAMARRQGGSTTLSVESQTGEDGEQAAAEGTAAKLVVG